MGYFIKLIGSLIRNIQLILVASLSCLMWMSSLNLSHLYFSLSLNERKQTAASKKSNWIATSIPSLDNLPKETNTVKVIDTMVPSLIDKNTNPTGAVSVVNYKSDTDTTTYCFSVSCASCKIPLTKGKVLPPKESKDARLECDFCGATYNLRSGVQVEKEGGKLLGFLFNQNKEERLPVYALGEKAGKVYISMP